MPVRGVARRYRANRRGYSNPSPLYALAGLNEDANSRVLRQDQLVVAENCGRKDSTLGTRPGPTYGDSDYPQAIASGASVQGIHEYSYNSGTNREMISVCGGVVRSAYGTTISKAATTISSGAGNQWTFADHQDKMFAAGGDTSTDGVWYYDGTNIGELFAASDFTTSPKYVFEKWNFLFLGGFTGTTYDDNPLIARYSDYGQDATLPASWPSTNVLPGQLLNENFGVGSFGSEYNTGFGEFFGKDQDFLLFLTNKRIMAFRPNDPASITGSETAMRLANTVPVGCVSQKAFVNLGADAGDAVFLNKDGVHSLAQSRQFGDVVNNYLSYPIRETFKTLNQSRLDEAWGAYWPQEGIVLFSVATGSNTTNNLILCMDIQGAQSLTPDSVRWYKWYLNGVNAAILTLARGADGKPYIYLGGDDGEVARFDRDNYQDLSSSGTISTVIQTSNHDFGAPSVAKGVGDAYIGLKGYGGGNIIHTTVFDDGTQNGQASHLNIPAASEGWVASPPGTGTMTWTTSKWGNPNGIKRHRVPGTGNSTTIGHRFQRNGANNPFFIMLLDQHIKRQGSTEDQEANMVS